MKKFIEKMQNKSNQEKQSFAFWTALSITLFVFVIWLMSFLYTFDAEQKVENSASLFDSLQSRFEELFKNEQTYGF